MIITVDGPAAAGKGTLSKLLAEKYQLAYFDTGMVYRSVGLMVMLEGGNLEDTAFASKKAGELDFIKMIELSKHEEFRSSNGGRAASFVSGYPEVRAKLLDMQRNFALNPTDEKGNKVAGVIYDGRDTGTVVCPNADIKFYVTANPEIRAKRRYAEFMQKGEKISFEEVLKDVIARDERDMNRAVAPLKPAEDAIIIDTSDKTVKQVFADVVCMIDEKLKK